MSQFRPLLSASCEDPSQLKFPVMASPKLDGIRCVVQHGQALTRSLKPIPNRHVRAALNGLPSVDGELIVGEANKPDVWNKTSSAIMSHDGEPEFTFFVFDFIIPHRPFHMRLEMAETVAERYGLHILKHKTISNLQQLMDYENEMVKSGYEGIMIRDPNGLYKYGRSTEKEGTLLKMKRFDDSEAEVVGVVERMHHIGPSTTNALGLTERDHKKENFAPAGDLGALLCRFPNDVEFEVGTGFTAEARAELWRNPPVGSVVRIKHQGVTPDGKPRFPVYVGFRDARDT